MVVFNYQLNLYYEEMPSICLKTHVCILSMCMYSASEFALRHHGGEMYTFVPLSLYTEIELYFQFQLF